MKLAIFVTEFPSITETFIARDVAMFLRMGHSVKLFHLTKYNSSEIIHDFAKPVVENASSYPYICSRRVLGALWRAVTRKPGRLAGLIRDSLKGSWYDPAHLGKTLAILPKVVAFSEDLEDWGAEHVHGEFAGHPGSAAWMVGRLTGLPYSITCRAHDIFVTQALLDVKLDEASFVRTISKYNIAFLSEHVPGFDAKKSHVIHSSVDLSQIHAVPAERSDVARILYIGSMEPRKGVDNLLHALAALSSAHNWRCDLIGKGSEKANLEQLARTLGLEDRVTFLGPRSFEEVADAYRSADVVVAPSVYGARGRTEGIPNVVIEALAHRRAVITSRISGIPELVEDNVTGLLVEPNDIAGLSAAISSVLEDPAGAQAFGDAGRKVVEREFDLTTNVKRQLELFERHAAPSQDRRTA